MNIMAGVSFTVNTKSTTARSYSVLSTSSTITPTEASGGIAKYVRLTDVIYPNGRDVEYGYGTAGEADDIMSRVQTITTSGEATPNAAYTYLGAGMVVVEDYVQSERSLTYLGFLRGRHRLRPLRPRRRSSLAGL